MVISQRNLPPLRYYDPKKTYNGYTLFAPLGGQDVWLMDMMGRFVHRWRMPYTPGVHGRLLPTGNLLYAGKDPDGPVPDFGGSAGFMQEVDWDGNLVWEYADPYLSHDFFRMDNGNTMLLKWAPIPKEVAAKIRGGIPGTERDGVIWSDVLHEVNPKGEVVWEWLAYEHLDFDIDVICPLCIRDRWGQANACYVMPDGNIIISYAFMSQIQIIEKSTGNVIWRWGHGEYGEGRRLGFQHNPTFLDNGNILLFDNGRHRPIAPDYSRVIEINPKTNEVEWEYMADPPPDFYGAFIGGAQRLPNGNTLICEGPKGRFFEVTPECEIVWEYVVPFFYKYARFGTTNMTFRAYRYGPEYPGLKGTGLDDVNLIYGPEAFESTPKVTKGLSITEEQSNQTPGAVGKSPEGTTNKEERLRSRMKGLGY
jgi:hypothetical protein